MTAHGGDHGEPSRDQAASFPHPDQPPPWQQYPHPPVDPQAPVNYPEYPPAYPPQQQQVPPPPSYGYPPPPYGGPPGFLGHPGYPVAPYYDPYHGYQGSQQQTNGLAVGSLITSLAGVVGTLVLGPLGVLICIVAIVLGVVALSQIKRTHQQGRGLAIAGVAIGSIMPILTLVGLMFVFTVASVLSPMVGH
jgi:hypothetical protein